MIYSAFLFLFFLLSNVLTLKRLERLKVLLFQTAIHCLVMIYVKRTQRTFYIYTYCTKILLKQHFLVYKSMFTSSVFDHSKSQKFGLQHTFVYAMPVSIAVSAEHSHVWILKKKIPEWLDINYLMVEAVCFCFFFFFKKDKTVSCLHRGVVHLQYILHKCGTQGFSSPLWHPFLPNILPQYLRIDGLITFNAKDTLTCLIWNNLPGNGD